MNLNSDVRKISLKTILIFCACLFLAVGLAFGGYGIYKKRAARPLTAEETKVLIANYLEKRTGESEFKISLEVMKEKNPWETLKQKFDAPVDYKAVYRAIGEDLFVADNLLGSTEAKDNQNGLRVLMELCDVSNDVAVDPWLGARIADAYIMPNLGKADNLVKRGISREQVMRFVAKVYENADDKDKQIELCKMALAEIGSSNSKLKVKSDYIRWKLANLLDRKGQHDEAIVVYKQITDPNFKVHVERRLSMGGKTWTKKGFGN